MPNEEYTIGELATLAGVTPRTIRYYVSIGLLPSPGQAGPGTRYGESHLARLRLIRRLQREHLPLGEITLRLEGLDDVAVEAALTADDLAASAGPGIESSGATAPDTWQRPTLGPAPGSALEYIDRLKERQARTPLPERRLAEPAASNTTARATGPGGSAMSLLEPEDLAVAQRSQWERVALGQYVELHIRRPLSRLDQKRVERLIRLGRELLEGEDTK